MQDTDLFFGKLRDNIALGKPEATDEEFRRGAAVGRGEIYRRPSNGIRHAHFRGRSQSVRWPKTGDRAGPRTDQKATGIVPGRADGAFRHPKRGRIPRAVESDARRADDHPSSPLTASLFSAWSTPLTWAHFAILDEVKRGNGKVVPPRLTQVVQTLRGRHRLAEITWCRKAAIVQQGQSLMRIDDTKFASEFGEIRERRAAMAARVARLEAEARGRSEVTFPDQLDQVVPAAVATEASVFKMRAQKLAQDVDVLNQQVTRLSGSLKLLDRELTLTRRLYEQKVVPEIEMLRLDRQATEMRGQLAESQSKIADVTSFRSQADEDLAKSKGDLAVLDENIKSAQDRVRRTDLKAPVHGIVNKLNVTTLGAVVQPGANVMDIIPLDDSLLVEGRIRPQDIAFIVPTRTRWSRFLPRFLGLWLAQGQGRAHQRRHHRRRKGREIGASGNVLPRHGPDRKEPPGYGQEFTADHSWHGRHGRSPHR